MPAVAGIKKGSKEAKAQSKKEALLLLKKEVITLQSPNLTAKQKTYETRTLPKHFMPKIAEKRLEWNNEIGK